NRSALMTRLAENARPAGRVVIGVPELDRAAAQVGGLIDPIHGGMRGAPKFPQPMMLEFLWRAGMRSGEARYFGAVNLTLERICQGGIYDHLGGGFSRYSVDESWLTPHFKKMLYDNAQLLELLALAHHRSGNAIFRTRAQETVAWLAREMTTERGAFCASLDADSEGEEGKFYVWSRDEIVRILGADEADFFARHYDVTAEGNFEGHNILNRLARVPASADEEARLAALRERLLAARAARVRPGLDDKVLADWNCLMIAALVNAGVLLGEAAWLDMGTRFQVHRHRHEPGRAPRSFLARRQAIVPRPGLRPCRDDPRRARAARGNCRGRLSRPRAGLARRARPPLRQPRYRRLFPHSRRSRAPGGAPECQRRRGNAQSQRGRGAKPHPARHPERARQMARASRSAIRRTPADGGGEPVHAS